GLVATSALAWLALPWLHVVVHVEEAEEEAREHDDDDHDDDGVPELEEHEHHHHHHDGDDDHHGNGHGHGSPEHLAAVLLLALPVLLPPPSPLTGSIAPPQFRTGIKPAAPRRPNAARGPPRVG